MARAYPFSHVAHGQHVGYSLKRRGDASPYFAYFRGRDGRRLERDTQQTAIQRAHTATRAIIEAEYEPPAARAATATWDEADARLAAAAAGDGRRGPTVEYYRKLLRRIRVFYADTAGPGDVTPAMAEAWKKAFATTPTRLKKLPSPHSVFSLLRGLSALWQTWLVDRLGACADNPWRAVPVPKTDRPEVRVIDDATLATFLAWLDSRYDGWELPRLFLETKAVTGCRLMDLCGLASDQVREGRLHFRADQTKGRKARSVPLPADLARRLEEVKGPTYLWESYPAGLKAALERRGRPTHWLKPDFVPARLYHWVETLFLDFGKEHPDAPKIHSHLLRKRAFTAAWDAGIDPRRAAIAIGCNPDTVMKHYVKLDEQQVTDDVMSQLAARLATAPRPADLPPPAGGPK